MSRFCKRHVGERSLEELRGRLAVLHEQKYSAARAEEISRIEVTIRTKEGPQSPCEGTCRIMVGFCMGCKRTLEEIAMWRDASDETKQQILERVRVRN